MQVSEKIYSAEQTGEPDINTTVCENIVETEPQEVADTEKETVEAAKATEPAEDVTESTEMFTVANVDWDNYLSGNVFDLTAYAEALDYTWSPDPERETLAMY